MSTKPVLNLAIFNHHTTPSNNINHDYNSCVAIQRLLVSLKYYNQLKIENDRNDQDIFSNFMDEVYKHEMFDDYYHLIQFHQSQLESIHDLAINEYEIPECDVSKCNFANRHFRKKDEKQSGLKIANKSRLELYIETMDSLHFYLLHMHQLGYRVTLKSDKTDSSDHETKSSENDDTYFDAKFSEIFDAIQVAKNTTAELTRTDNKFHISVADTDIENSEQITSIDPEQDHLKTFLDFIYSQLSPIDNLSVPILKQIIFENGYDTESVDMDVQLYIDDGISNISRELQDESVMAKLIEIFSASKSMYKYLLLTVTTSKIHHTQNR